MATAWKPLLFSIAYPWAGPSWDLDQKVPRAPNSLGGCKSRSQLPRVNPCFSCRTVGLWRASLGAKVTVLTVPAPAAPTAVHICMHLHGGHKGSPRTPRHTQGCTHPCLQAHSELCLQICPQRPSPARDGDMDNLLGHRTQGIYMCQGVSGMCTINNQDTQTPKRDTADRL